MSLIEELAHRATAVAAFLGIALAALAHPASATAGTYPMYQCSASHPNVAPGWSVFKNQTNASTVLNNSCPGGGVIGDYVFSHGQPGAVEENGNSGSQVGIALNVPGSAPDVSIASMSALVQVSAVSGNDAFLGFNAAGQGLTGAEEIHNGGSSFAANDNWTLAQGARDFEAYVNCTTDGSNTNCFFPESTHVPALSNVTLTLVDSTPPTLSGISGTLANAAAHGSTVSGSQTLGFTGQDADSGVLSATLTLTPQGSGSEYTRAVSFSGQCTYESWNACPLTQNVSPFTVPTATLKDGTYAVTLAVTDAAGNVASQSLGTIATHNAPTVSAPPAITGTPVVGQSLTATPAAFSSEPEAGKVTIAAQWQRCDSAGNNCAAIAGATGASYNVLAADEGHTLRYEETVSNNDGSANTQSAQFGSIQKETTEAREAREAREAKEAKEAKEREVREVKEREVRESKGANGSNGANGTNGSNGANSVTVAIVGPGSNQGSTVIGSTARWRLSLKVNPRRVHRGTTIRLTGLVSTSPRPSNGKLVYLQARSVVSKWKGHGRARHRVGTYGKWVTFQAFRAHSDGTFSSVYRFRLAGRHIYQFQAVAPAEGQYRNPSGASNQVIVIES